MQTAQPLMGSNLSNLSNLLLVSDPPLLSIISVLCPLPLCCVSCTYAVTLRRDSLSHVCHLQLAMPYLFTAVVVYGLDGCLACLSILGSLFLLIAIVLDPVICLLSVSPLFLNHPLHVV
jgi:hypothetical protein